MTGSQPPFHEGLRSPEQLLSDGYQTLQAMLLVAPYTDSHNVRIPIVGTDLVGDCSDYDGYLHKDTRGENDDPTFDVVASREALLRAGKGIVAITLRVPGNKAERAQYIMLRPGDVNRYDGMLGSYMWGAMGEKPEVFTDWDPERVVVLDMTETGEAFADLENLPDIKRLAEQIA